MPFTPSHAVVALPFIRTLLPPAAIAVGAMTPDLPLFVRGTPLRYSITHDFAWMPLTVAIAVVLLLVWRCVLRPAARELAPRWLARRLPREWDAGAAVGLRVTFSRRGRADPSWTGSGLLAIALAVGVASHIAWDLFTHEGRWGSAVIPAPDERWGPLTGYTWLQHASSLAGLAILAVWALVRLHGTDAGPVERRLPEWVRWGCWLSLPIVLLGTSAIVLAVRGPFDTTFTAAHLAYQVLLPACAVWGAVGVAVCATIGARIQSSRRNPR